MLCSGCRRINLKGKEENMKKNKILIAVFAVLTAASAAMAKDINIDFDGKKSAPLSFSELLESGSAGHAEGAALAVSEPERAQPAANTVLVREKKINVTMRTRGFIKKETIICEPVKGAPAMAGCRKESNSAKITREDVAAMSLRKYFPSEKAGFASLLDQTKHGYTNHSGPQTFECEDACGRWDWSVTISVFPPYLEEASWTCVEDSHECKCIEGCY
ncbi:MAG TPA: hypothetical protein DCZ93_00860 [Elusimicrobia bacterium]|nr:hypothetical protein [Elusimicrobiota bacterium]